MKNMKKILSLMLALVMMLALASCGSAGSGAASGSATGSGSAAEDASDLAYVKDKGTLIVGITDFKPMDYKNDAGEWVGFDADMATAFAKSLGVDVQFIEIDWDNKIMELNAKSIDCVWNGMTLTDEVKKSMATSNPYCDNAQVVVVPADKADQYQDVDSLKDLSFAVESGSAGEAEAKNQNLTYTSVSTQSDAVMEVSSGASDACVIDLLMAGAIIGEGTSYPKLTHTVKLNSEQYGAAFRTDSDLAEVLNKFLADSYKDGSMQKIAETYGVQESLIAQ